jgi:hypothetical protein
MACTHRKDVDLLDAVSVQPGDRDAWQIVYAARIKGDAARYLREQQVQRQLLAKYCRAGKEKNAVSKEPKRMLSRKNFERSS